MAALFDLGNVSVASVVKQHDRDPQRLFGFVRDSLRPEAYSGALRGPTGTLLALGGNALDRALLLQALLIEAGVEAKLAKGTLDQTQATRLSAACAKASVIETSSTHSVAILDAVEGAATRALRQASGLLAGAPTLTAPPPASREHWWVQARIGGKWTDLDPAVNILGGQPPQSAQVMNEAPDPAYHQVILRVVIRRGTEEQAALRYESTSADLASQDALLAFLPGAWTKPSNAPTLVTGIASGLGGAMAAATDRSRARAVLAVGEQLVLGEAFDVGGPASGTSSGGFPGLSGLAGAIGGEPSQPPSSGWLEITIVSPGVPPSTSRAPLWQPGSDPLTVAVGIGVHPGPLRNPAMLAQAQGQMEVGAAGLLATLHRSAAFLLDKYGADVGGKPLGFTVTTPRVILALARSGPDRVRLDLDLRFIGAVPADPQLAPAVAARLRAFYGAVATASEAHLMALLASKAPSGPGFGVRASSAGVILAEAERLGIPLRTMATPTDSFVIQVPAAAAEHLKEDLLRGCRVAVTSKPVPLHGVERTAWWSLEPSSGTLVGVTDEGYRGADLEYGIVTHSGTHGARFDLMLFRGGKFVDGWVGIPGQYCMDLAAIFRTMGYVMRYVRVMP